MPTLYLLTTPESLPSVVTFQEISLLIIIFIILTFILSPFDSSAPFQASSLSFIASSVSAMPSHQHKAVLLDILTLFL